MAASKNRVFRAPDDVYDRARERASREGNSLSEVLVECLRRYGDRTLSPLSRRNAARAARSARDAQEG